MCLIFISLHVHPVYQLVVAANRDEFYDRKTLAASFWSDQPGLLAGRDMEAQGTWLGMNTNGKVSILTNYRDPSNINPAAPSRGKLVSNFLATRQSAPDYLNEVDQVATQYNGFNLIVGNSSELWYYSNYRRGTEKLTTGFYGLSNHLLDTPWPKIKKGKEKLEPILSKRDISEEELFRALYDENRASDAELPETGIGLERERALSAMFIKTPNYGSRSSTVIMVDHAGHVRFSERVYALSDFSFTTQTFEFDIPSL